MSERDGYEPAVPRAAAAEVIVWTRSKLACILAPAR